MGCSLLETRNKKTHSNSIHRAFKVCRRGYNLHKISWPRQRASFHSHRCYFGMSLRHNVGFQTKHHDIIPIDMAEEAKDGEETRNTMASKYEPENKRKRSSKAKEKNSKK